MGKREKLNCREFLILNAVGVGDHTRTTKSGKLVSIGGYNRSPETKKDAVDLKKKPRQTVNPNQSRIMKGMTNGPMAKKSQAVTDIVTEYMDNLLMMKEILDTKGKNGEYNQLLKNQIILVKKLRKLNGVE